MKIESISLSIFELPSNTGQFDLVQESYGTHERWVRQPHGAVSGECHVLHVHTNGGLEGISTVGDARYTTMRKRDLEQLRILALGADPLDRERLSDKLGTATRGMFAKPGWFGAFDNCLWDIAGKAAGRPVWALIAAADGYGDRPPRHRCPAYYNYGGITQQAAVESALGAVDQGFRALKDHFRGSPDANIDWSQAVRLAVGSDVALLADHVLSGYVYDQALQVGRALEALGFEWLEEPLPDAEIIQLQKLCAALDIPVMALETLMHDHTLCAQYIQLGATDRVRANARHGTTPLLKLAKLADARGRRIELNGPGGLFGLIHAHLTCAIRNTSYYEYFPGGSRDEAGKSIGLLNPPIPVDGYITPPDAPGWGAEWDWSWFRSKRVTTL